MKKGTIVFVMLILCTIFFPSIKAKASITKNGVTWNQISWNKELDCWNDFDASNNPLFRSNPDYLTEDTLCYRSGVYSIPDGSWYREENYFCSQGRNKNGELVPISKDCLMPYYNSLDADVKYSYYKRNEYGYIEGTNDPAEAYTINEITYPGLATDGDITYFYLHTCTDKEGKKRLVRVMPTVSLKTTVGVNWDQSFKLLDLINEDRINPKPRTNEKGVTETAEPLEPLVMEENTVKIALLRMAELTVVPHHYRPLTAFVSGATSEYQYFDFNTLSISGENICGNSHGVHDWVNDYGYNSYYIFGIGNTQSLEAAHQGYYVSDGHYAAYMNSASLGAGIIVGSSRWGNPNEPELFSSGNPDTVKEIKNEGEYTGFHTYTIDVPVPDFSNLSGSFDYEALEPTTTMTVGQTKRVAGAFRPIDYWFPNSLTSSQGALAYSPGDYANNEPFDFETLQYSSSNEEIATVDSEGNVSAKKSGTVTITTSLYGTVNGTSYLAHTHDYTITISKEILETPAAEVDYINECLTGLEPDATYFLGKNKVQASASGTIALSRDLFGTEISLVRASTDDVKYQNSAAQQIILNEIPVPELPNIYSTTDSSIVVKTPSTSIYCIYAFSLDGTNWTTVLPGYFAEWTNLTSNTSYTLYIRINAMEDYFQKNPVSDVITMTMKTKETSSQDKDPEDEKDNDNPSTDPIQTPEPAEPVLPASPTSPVNPSLPYHPNIIEEQAAPDTITVRNKKLIVTRTIKAKMKKGYKIQIKKGTKWKTIKTVKKNTTLYRTTKSGKIRILKSGKKGKTVPYKITSSTQVKFSVLKNNPTTGQNTFFPDTNVKYQKKNVKKGSRIQVGILNSQNQPEWYTVQDISTNQDRITVFVPKDCKVRLGK